MAALPRLNRPGSCRGTGIGGPSTGRTVPATWSTCQCGCGRARPQRHRHRSSATSSASPQRGQPNVSADQLEPAPTQTVRAAAEAAQTTIGSSTLATTTVRGWRISAPDRAAATPRTSLPRSSWSRLRLSSTITCGSTASATAATCSSSTSRTARRAPADAVSAATAPSGMLAPVALCATGPAPPSRPASRWLVVVLPLVPETSATLRPAASLRKASGSSASVTRPPMIAPPAQPSPRDRPPTAEPSRTAVSVQLSRAARRSPANTSPAYAST